MSDRQVNMYTASVGSSNNFGLHLHENTEEPRPNKYAFQHLYLFYREQCGYLCEVQ